MNLSSRPTVTNFIQPYFYQFFNNSHGLNSYRKLSKRSFNSIDASHVSRRLSRTCGAGAELLRSERELTTKVEEQPWPQLVRCASICCRVCGCVFQED